jgi:CRP-like cAMP-binding protein
MAEKLFRLSDDEKTLLESAFVTEVEFLTGSSVIEEAVSRPKIYGVEVGWLACYKLLPDGRRQMISFQLPGSIIGLRDLLLKRATHSTMTLTAVRLRSAPADDLLEIMVSHPRVAVAVVWMLGNEEASVVDDLVNVGQRSGVERMATLIFNMRQLLNDTGLVQDEQFEFPVTHQILGEKLGMSAVHVSRTLRLARERDLFDLKSRRVTIINFEKLTALVEFAKNGFLMN